MVRRTRKRRGVGGKENGSQRLRSSGPNGVWSYALIEDRTGDGRRLMILVMVDEFTREAWRWKWDGALVRKR